MAEAAKSALDVLLDEKRVNDLLEQRSGLKAFVRQSCNILLFILFLALYTILAVGEPFGDLRAFEGHVRRRFDERAAFPLAEVTSASTFWQYTYDSFLPALYGPDINPASTGVNRRRPVIGTHRRRRRAGTAGAPVYLPLEGGNALLGVARLRMLKVGPNADCEIPENFQGSYRNCYGPYQESNEEREPFGPVASDGQRQYRYSSATGGVPFHGEMMSYPQSGYMAALTRNYEESASVMMAMQRDNFVSQATRAVFLEFTIYNFNQGYYAVCRIVFEVAASGLWHTTFDVEVLTQRHLAALGFGTTTEWLLLVGEGILVLFVLRYLFEEASELFGSSQKLEYFKDPWNLLDLTNLIMIIATLGLRIRAWAIGGGLTVNTSVDQSVLTFTDYSEAAESVRTLRGVVAFNTVLTWFKTVKYYNVVPYIRVFMHTVSLSRRMLLSFVIIFLAVHFGFVVSYCVAFGESLSELRSIWKAHIFLLRTMLGDGSFEQILNLAPEVGALLMILLVVGMLFVLMNLFSAIMIRALADTRRLQDRQMAKEWEQLIDRMKQVAREAADAMRLELRFRGTVPGLYARLMKRRKKQDDLEVKRDQAVLERQQAGLPDDLLALGPGSPTCGRRQKRALASVAIRDGDSDDGSEPDLGPLYSKDQLNPKSSTGDTSSGEKGNGRPGGYRGGGNGGLPMLGGSKTNPKAHAARGESSSTMSGSSSTAQTPTGSSSSPEEDAEAIELLLSATRHITSGIVERTRGARSVLFSEMSESKEVLTGVGAVLQVLSKRARDLQAQQVDVLRNF